MKSTFTRTSIKTSLLSVMFLVSIYLNNKLVSNSAINSIVLFLIYLVPIFLERNDFGINYNSFNFYRKKIILSLKISSGLFLFGYGINYIHSLMIFGYEDIILKGYEFSSINQFAISILVFPIVEELFFRGIILKNLSFKLSSSKAIIISSILFSLAHFFSDSSLLVALLTGIVLGLVYVRTQNVFICILIHSIYNLLVLLLSDKINVIMLEQNVVVESILLFVIFFLGVIILIQKIKGLNQESF